MARVYIPGYFARQEEEERKQKEFERQMALKGGITGRADSLEEQRQEQWKVNAENDAALARLKLSESGATGRTAMTQAGELQRTGMTEAGATQRTGMTQAGDTTRTGMTIAGENQRNELIYGVGSPSIKIKQQETTETNRRNAYDIVYKSMINAGKSPEEADQAATSGMNRIAPGAAALPPELPKTYPSQAPAKLTMGQVNHIAAGRMSPDNKSFNITGDVSPEDQTAITEHFKTTGGSPVQYSPVAAAPAPITTPAAKPVALAPVARVTNPPVKTDGAYGKAMTGPFGTEPSTGSLADNPFRGKTYSTGRRLPGMSKGGIVTREAIVGEKGPEHIKILDNGTVKVTPLSKFKTRGK